MSNLYKRFYAEMPVNGHLESKTPHCEPTRCHVLCHYIICFDSSSLYFSGMGSCSCTDCEQSCAPPDFTPFQKEKFAISEKMDTWQIGVVVVFVGIAMISMTIFVFVRYLCPHSHSNVIFVEEYNKTHNEIHPNYYANHHINAKNNRNTIAGKTDLAMTWFFTKIITACATHPIKTLLIMLSLAGALCSGITQLR